jgi:hypothetical protein
MMKLSKRFAVLLLVHLIVCASALYSSAGEEPERKWTSYMRGRDGTEYFYDKDALIKTPQRTFQVWRKRVFAPGSAQKEIVTFDQIDCREAEYRSLQLSVTYWDGRVKTFDKQGPWAHVYSNSPEEYLLEEHCK